MQISDKTVKVLWVLLSVSEIQWTSEVHFLE